MTRRSAAVVSGLVCLTTVAAPATADTTLDDYLQDPQNIKSVTAIGYTLQAMKFPADEGRARKDFARFYWSTAPDAGLSPDAATAEMKRFQTALDDVAAVVRDYDVTRLTFVGLDRLATWECQDWYYLAATPRGPVLFVVSVEMSGRFRLFSIRPITRWDPVKTALDHVQYRAGDKVINMTYKRPTTEPAAKP